MAVTVDQVVVDLEARLTKYTANLQKAEADLNRLTQRIERKKIDMGAAGKSAAFSFSRVFGGLLPALTAATVATAIQSAVKSASDLKDFADRVGIGTDALQALQFAAKTSGAEIESFNQGLAFFSRNIGQAARGSGDLYDILKANGVAIRDTNGDVRDQNALLLDFADLVKNAGSEQEKATLIQRGLGRGAEELGTLFRDGAAGIRTLTDEAHRIGVIISEDELQKAHDLDDAFDRLTSIVGTELKSAIIGAAGAFQEFWERASGTHTETAKDLQATVDQLERLKVAASEGKGAIDRLWDSIFGGDTGPSIDDRLASTRAKQAALATQSLTDQLNAMNAPKGKTTSLPSTAPKELDEFQKATRAIAEHTQQVNLETTALGLSNAEAERQRMILQLTQAAIRAGLPLDDKRLAQINQLAAAYAEATRVYEIAAATQDRINQASQAAFDVTEQGFLDVLTGAKSFKDALVDILKQLILIAAKNWFASMFMPTGSAASGIFGLIGKLFGFAEGGVMTPNGPRTLKRFASGGVSNRAAIFGEGSMPEAAVPLPDGRSIPVKFKSNRAKSGQGSDNSVHVNLDIANDFRGADAQAIAVLSARIAKIKPEAVAEATAAVARTRGMRPGYLRGAI